MAATAIAGAKIQQKKVKNGKRGDEAKNGIDGDAKNRRKNKLKKTMKNQQNDEDEEEESEAKAKPEESREEEEEGNKASTTTTTTAAAFGGGSSRLILKNLPSGKKSRWDEAKIRAQFSRFGTLTDVKMKFNEHTGACKFAFVGFSTPESCQEAIKKMNGAFIQGAKLQVEECKPLPAERAAITRQIAANKIVNKKKANPKGDEGGEGGDGQDDADKLLERQILDTGRLFLRNLCYSCTSDHLRALCTPFGPLADVECIVDKAGKCKGFALCTFMFPEHALAAWRALDGTVFMGRMLHVIAGQEKVKRADEAAPAEQYRSAFQRERQTARKENAAKSGGHTWNALFLGTDAVAEQMAENYEVQKRHLLLEEGENSTAVRLAMAEARLVRETRKFLLAHGVRLDAFSRPAEGAQRSKTVILVKNLSARQPPEGQEARLGKLFGRFGQVKRVLMPPEHGISALVEMGTERDAKRAFEALAYSKGDKGGDGGAVQNQKPLYLEWAPSDVFDEQHPSRAIEKYGYQNSDKTEEGDEEEDKGRDEENDDEAEDGKEEKGDGKKKDEPERTKLLVRNVPFQANLKEISQLFSAFGELKFVRMPKKPGADGHRGFCFVDFVSVGDARRAMDALAPSTHLYGRRLVLEWANPGEEGVEELRRRTKHKMGGGRMGRMIKNKRPKMRSF